LRVKFKGKTVGQNECKKRKCRSCWYLEQANRSYLELKAVFESSSDCILVWDQKYNYLYANQAAMFSSNRFPKGLWGGI
jgi:hypothetical protein